MTWRVADITDTNVLTFALNRPKPPAPFAGLGLPICRLRVHFTDGHRPIVQRTMSQDNREEQRSRTSPSARFGDSAECN